MTHIVNLKELRENMAHYESRVAKGDSFIVMKRSKPVFRLSPVSDDQEWESVIDFTKVRKGGIEISDLISRLKAV